MKKYAKNEISLMQFIFIINGAQVGTGIMSLSGELAASSGTDGWMSLIIGWLLNLVACLLIIQVFKRFPDDTVYDLLKRLFGKWLSLLVVIPITLYFTIFCCLVQIKAMLYIKAWFLPQTPDYLIMFLFAIPTYMVAGKGLRILGRYNELVFYLTAWMPFTLLFVLKYCHWLHLLPLFKDGIMPVIRGVEPSIYSILGFEVLWIIYPFLKYKEKATQGVIIANSITILAYIMATIICFAFFSPDEITSYHQPLLSLLKLIEFSFLERFDMIFLAFFLFVVSSSWISFMFMAAFGVSQMVRKQDHSPYVAIIAVLFIVMVFAIHPSWNQANEWQKWSSRMGIGVAYALPLLLWAYVQVYIRFHKGDT